MDKSENNSQQTKLWPFEGPNIEPSYHQSGIRLDENHILILEKIFDFPHYSDSFEQTKLKKSTFKRKLRELLTEGLIIKYQDKTNIRNTRYHVHPDLVNSKGQISQLVNEQGPHFRLLRKITAMGDIEAMSIIIIRSHRIYYRVNYLHKPMALQNKLARLSQVKLIPMRNWNKFSKKFSIPTRGSVYNVIVDFNLHCININFPEIYGYSAKENMAEADLRVFEVINHLEVEFGVKLGKPKFERMVERKLQEHEWLHHSLALLAAKQGVIVKSQNFELGSKSKGKPAVETTNAKTSHNDMENIVTDFETMRTKKIWVKDIIPKVYDDQGPKIASLETKTNQLENDAIKASNNIKDLTNTQNITSDSISRLGTNHGITDDIQKGHEMKIGKIENYLGRKSIWDKLLFWRKKAYV